MSQVQGQLWDSVVLEQWSAAITTPSMRAAHMGPHNMGKEFIWQVLTESQRV